MSRPQSRSSLWATLSSIGWPVFLGALLTIGFFLLVFRGPLDQPAFHRYFAGHPINMVETALFFIGLVALGLKTLDVMGQYGSLGGIALPPSDQVQSGSKAAEYLDLLASLSDRVRTSYLGRRLTDALELVERKGSAEGLDEELKYLSDMDANRQQESYALVRIVVWATPMLGFLGTVVGITKALGDLNPAELANNLEQAMSGLLGGLYVAFDTTAIALAFSMVLMFIQFAIDRMEVQLLAEVDQRVGHEMVGRFEMVGASSDPMIQSIHRMSQAVMKATEQLVQRQAEIWQTSIQAAHQQWQRVSASSAEQMQQSLAAALDHSLASHAAHMAQIEQSSAEQLQQRWEQWQNVLSENAQLLHAQQQGMTRQGELMTRAIEATSDVMKLEQALNQNLSALAGSKNFEETVMSLAAAIHLLNARLSKAEAPHVDLTATSYKGRAA